MFSSLLLFALKDAALAGAAAAAFSFCLGVPRHLVVYAGGCAAVGHSLQAVLIQLNCPLGLAVLSGAFCIGMLSVLLAKYFFVSRIIFTVPGIIPMLPGTFIFRSLLTLIQSASLSANTPPSLVIDAFSGFLKAAVILGSIAVGISLPNLFFYYHKPDI